MFWLLPFLGIPYMLSSEHVLTCAHVVDNARGADGRVRVRIEGRGASAHAAAVLLECWQPTGPEQTGGVAVLLLDAPEAGAPRARLRSTWRRGEAVEVFGFSDGIDNGVNARGRRPL